MDVQKILELKKEFRIGTASPIKWVLSNVFLIKAVLPTRRFQGWGHSEVPVLEHRNTLQRFVSPRLIRAICLFLNSSKQFPPAMTGAAVLLLSCSTGCHCRSIHWNRSTRTRAALAAPSVPCPAQGASHHPLWLHSHGCHLNTWHWHC